MKRNDVLKKLGYSFPDKYAKRVIVCTDAHNEADDQFAIAHHLLTPSENVLGIVACHYEYMTNMMHNEAKKLGWTAEQTEEHLKKFLFAPLHRSVDLSYDEIVKVLELMKIEDIPVFRGAADPLSVNADTNDGVEFIIKEARKRNEGRLYVCFLGAITDMAIALQKAPDIADNVTVIWIGGGGYPNGSDEFNLMQDVKAANIVFSSKAEVWQIPNSAYTKVVVSFTELMTKFKPCGEIGKYLTENLFRFHGDVALGCNPHNPIHRDAWILGDNPTVSVLAVECFGNDYTVQKARHFNDNYSYGEEIDKEIRVYHSVHERFIIEDLAAKLALCYKG